MTETSRIGLFGKLPAHPDFVRWNAGGALAQAMDRWTHEGLVDAHRRWGADWEERFDRASPLYFVYRHQSPNEVLIGVSHPSRDQSGRRYPLSIFTRGTLKRGGRGLHAQPYGHSPFLSYADGMLGQFTTEGMPASGEPLAELGRMVPDQDDEITRAFDRYFDDVTMESFWRGIFGDFADPRKYRVIKNLFGALAPLRGDDPSRLKAALRMPIAPQTNEAAAQSAIWTLLSMAVLGTDRLADATIYWRGDKTLTVPGSCIIAFRAPQAMLWSHVFVSDADGSDGVWDTERIGADSGDDVRVGLGGPLATALDQPALRMRDFLKQI